MISLGEPDVKGNGVVVTNDRLAIKLSLSDQAVTDQNVQPDPEEIYPTVGDYTFLKEIDGKHVLFDAVSDQIVKINPSIYQLFQYCDGFHSLKDLTEIAQTLGLPVGIDDLNRYYTELSHHKLARMHLRRKVESPRVLLINPPLPFSSENYAFQNVYPPLGLLYLAGQLVENGCEVEFLDMSVDDMQPGEIGRYIDQLNGPIDMVGISLNMTCSYARAVRIAGNVRDALPGVSIIMGGNHATMTYEELLVDRHCDLVCIGPGDHLIVQICDSLFRKAGPIEDVPGLAYWSRGKVQRTTPTKPTKIIKTVDFPAYHLIDIDRYDIGGRIPVITSTGCPYDCKYCSTVKFNGRRVSYFPVERVVGDLKKLMAMFGTNGFNFLDDSFSFNRKRMMEICALIQKEGLDIHWTCNTRVDMVDAEMLLAMKAAGCVGIFFGIESMDQAVLSRMHKRVKTEEIRDAVQWARDAGIMVRQSFIVGLPGETPETLKSTDDFIADTAPEEVQLSMLTIYPGTELAATPEKYDLTVHPLKWEEHNINIPHASTESMDREAIFTQYLKMRLNLAEAMR